jgi:hypothetical protein
MDFYVADFRRHPSSFAMELASAVSSSFNCFAQGFIMAKTSTTSLRNMPIWEVSESAWQTAQASSRNLPNWEVSESALQIAQAQDQDRDSPLADTIVWEMARISLPKPMKLGIYLLECPRGGADVLTLLGHVSLIAELRKLSNCPGTTLRL